MPVDLNDLQLQEEVLEVSDADSYADAQEYPPPLDPGVYTFSQGAPTFKPSADKKSMNVAMTQTVAVGDMTGRTLNDSVSDKVFERNGAKVSMAHDHLRALGDRTPYRSHQEIADAISNHEGKLFKAQTDWEASCKNCQEPDKKGTMQRVRVKGARSFPLGADGKRVGEIVCPGPRDPQYGKSCGETLRAFSRITRRIPA